MMTTPNLPSVSNATNCNAMPASIAQLPTTLSKDLLNTSSDLLVLTLTVRQIDTLKLPTHTGSMLRGAFGVALRRLTCITGLESCGRCPLKTHCVFPNLFEVSALPKKQGKYSHRATNPYVIDVPRFSSTLASDTLADRHLAIKSVIKKDANWQFNMTLIGQASEHLTIIKKAWSVALQTGLGQKPPYAKASLIDMTTLALSGASDALAWATLPNQHIKQVTLHFVTPFRSQYGGKVASKPEHFEPLALLLSLYHRVQACQAHLVLGRTFAIGYVCVQDFKNDLATLTFQSKLRQAGVSRRSNRQARKISVVALQGTLTMLAPSDSAQQALSRLLPILKLGERLHVGKGTSMGFGQYWLEVS